jgi:hypothetical protein
MQRRRGGPGTGACAPQLVGQLGEALQGDARTMSALLLKWL